MFCELYFGYSWELLLLFDPDEAVEEDGSMNFILLLSIR